METYMPYFSLKIRRSGKNESSFAQVTVGKSE